MQKSAGTVLCLADFFLPFELAEGCGVGMKETRQTVHVKLLQNGKNPVKDVSKDLTQGMMWMWLQKSRKKMKIREKIL